MIEIKTTRQKLHDIIDKLDDNSVERFFNYVEDEIDSAGEYTEEFREELKKRREYYLNGGKMVSPEEVKKHVNQLLEKVKNEHV